MVERLKAFRSLPPSPFFLSLVSVGVARPAGASSPSLPPYSAFVSSSSSTAAGWRDKGEGFFAPAAGVPRPTVDALSLAAVE